MHILNQQFHPLGLQRLHKPCQSIPLSREFSFQRSSGRHSAQGARRLKVLWRVGSFPCLDSFRCLISLQTCCILAWPWLSRFGLTVFARWCKTVSRLTCWWAQGPILIGEITGARYPIHIGSGAPCENKEHPETFAGV